MMQILAAFTARLSSVLSIHCDSKVNLETTRSLFWLDVTTVHSQLAFQTFALETLYRGGLSAFLVDRNKLLRTTVCSLQLPLFQRCLHTDLLKAKLANEKEVCPLIICPLSTLESRWLRQGTSSELIVFWVPSDVIARCIFLIIFTIKWTRRLNRKLPPNSVNYVFFLRYCVYACVG